MKTNSPQTEILTDRLSSYGLNPGDWRVVVIGDERIKVINKEDDDFCFQGTLKLKSNRWDISQLSLVQI
jgi:hypothetical protein